MRGIPNRSEFIRAAILSALDSVCPLCKGSGILTPDQRKHWVEFAEHHALAECEDCHAVHLVCEAARRIRTQGEVTRWLAREPKRCARRQWLAIGAVALWFLLLAGCSVQPAGAPG